jgi:multiple sugar transport system substrate-binding protein
MLAGDMAPDIVMPIGVSGVALFFDQWADFTPFIQADNYDMTRFIGKTVETHNYPGKGMLGLPMCVYPTAMYYNVDIFDAAGVEYPPHQFEAAYADGDPWTYDKLREVAALMSLDVNGNNANDANFDAENMKQYGFEFLWLGIEPAIKFGDKWGGVVDTTDYKKSAILDKQFVDYLTWEKDNIWTYHIRANGQQSGAFYDSAGDPFGSGMLAMAETHTWMKYAWSGWSNAFNWDIAAVPQGPNGKILSVVDADTVVMPKAGKHQKEAWEVIKWFFENEQLKKLIDNYGCLPAEQSLADKWVEETKVEFPNQDLQVWLDAMNYLEPGPNHESWTPQWGKINTVVGNAIGQITNGTNLDVSAVLTEADKEIQQILDDYWK